MQDLRLKRSLMFYGVSGLALCLTACAASTLFAHPGDAKADGPHFVKKPLPIQKGDAQAGRNVFRFETFGDEGFWTDAVRMPQGMKQAKLTPLQALKAGVSVDVDAVPADMLQAIGAELKTDLSPASAPPA